MSRRFWSVAVGSSDSFLPPGDDVLSPYEIDLLLNSRCSSLAPCGFLYTGGTCTMVLSSAGFLTLPCMLQEAQKPLGGYYQSCLSWLISIMEAVIHAGEFMIPENHLSLLPEDIFFQSGPQGYLVPRLILCPGGIFSASLSGLCSYLYEQEPRTHADRLQAAMHLHCRDGRPDPSEVLALLRDIRNESMKRF